jgi:hypothetical protein
MSAESHPENTFLQSLDSYCPVRDKMWVEKNNPTNNPGAVGTKCGIRRAHEKYIVQTHIACRWHALSLHSSFFLPTFRASGTMEFNVNSE